MFTHFLEHCRRAQNGGALRNLERRCWRLLSEAGAANSAAMAVEIMGAYSKLPQPERLAFFQFLDTALRPNAREVLDTATAYASNSDDPGRVLALQRAAEPPRQELLRRINRADGGTAAIIAMRRDLLRALPRHSQLRAVDSDFRHLLASWFNPGFLTLQQVDWHAPAALLEKIIRHEAVHAVTNWADLRRRLQTDRRCFAFFHPQIPGEPLIFVEVALVKAMPRSIQRLINEHALVESAHEARVAAFYSISNCEPGLAGVSLGNFLIKRVAERLRTELPVLKRFCTLSPVPTLRAWMTGERCESA